MRPSASAPSSAARCDTDMSPGTEIVPATRRTGRTTAFMRASPAPRARVRAPPRASPIAARHEVPPAAEDRLVSGERVEDRPAILAEDVRPERLGRRRDPRRVGEAAPRERQGVPVRGRHQRVGRQVRHVADLRHEMVVHLGREPPHRAPQPLPERRHRRHRGLGRVGGRRHEGDPPLEEVRGPTPRSRSARSRPWGVRRRSSTPARAGHCAAASTTLRLTLPASVRTAPAER